MQTSNANKSGSSNNPVWQFLAEYSLSEFMPEEETGDALTTGFLCQTIRDLGIPPECLNKIKRTLIEFVQQARVHFNQGSLEFPGRIRVFCQKKMIDDANSVKTSSLCNEEQAIKHAPIKVHSSTIMNGGWGYFIIERSGDDAGSSESARPLIDLYLYQEGE